MPFAEVLVSGIVLCNRLKTAGDVSKRVHHNEPFGSPAEVHLLTVFGGRNLVCPS
jgi:hypothetical protein